MDLVLLVCLLSSPETCREEHLAAGYEPSDPRLCMTAAVPVIAEWSETNPEWRVARWKCGAASRAAALDAKVGAN